jgi:cell division protein FtsA
MANNNIITAIDIGTTSIKGLSVVKNPNSLEVVAKAVQQSFGVRKGVVIDVDEVSKKINQVISQLQDESGENIERVFININGSHIFSTLSRGNIVISRADQKISSEDIERVMQAAQTFSLPSNKEILDVFPCEFIVDGEGGVKEPLGMKGVRLEVEILALGALSPYIQNLTNAVLNSSLQKIDDITLSSLAAARAVLTPQEKELGVYLIDIGAGTIGLSAFIEGNLIHAFVLPVGSSNITNDIAIGLKTSIEIAEKIKKEFVTCPIVKSKKRKKSAARSQNIRIELSDQESPLIFSPKKLTEIVEPRISEIFREINKEIKKVSSNHLFPAGVVLTGGGAKLPNIVEFAKNELELPCRIGVLKELKGLEDDPVFSVVSGLILDGVDLEDEELPSIWPRIKSKLEKMFNKFKP